MKSVRTLGYLWHYKVCVRVRVRLSAAPLKAKPPYIHVYVACILVRRYKKSCNSHQTLFPRRGVGSGNETIFHQTLLFSSKRVGSGHETSIVPVSEGVVTPLVGWTPGPITLGYLDRGVHPP